VGAKIDVRAKKQKECPKVLITIVLRLLFGPFCVFFGPFDLKNDDESGRIKDLFTSKFSGAHFHLSAE
jgi:hypothetical protein